MKAPAALVVTCPPPVSLPACGTADITTEYNKWKAGFTKSGDCNLTDNMASFPPLVINADGSVNLSFTYKVTGDCASGQCSSSFTVPPCPCNTAYGTLGNSNAYCFTNWGFSNWGWTNKITAAGTYSLPMYQGESDCIPSPENLVGYATAIYNSTAKTVTIKIELLAGFVMSSAHIYVGTDPLPKVKGKYTTSPGQYTWNSGEFNPRVSVIEVTLSMRSAPFYLIVHALACNMPVKQAQTDAISRPVTDISMSMNSSLLMVYPNPFNEKVTFEFVSRKDVRAILEIHNVLGQKVATLMDRTVREGVLNKVEYQPYNQVPGIFVYRLMLGNEIQTGRIIYNRNR